MYSVVKVGHKIFDPTIATTFPKCFPEHDVVPVTCELDAETQSPTANLGLVDFAPWAAIIKRTTKIKIEKMMAFVL